MKNLFLSIAILLVGGVLQAQTLRRVNNNPGMAVGVNVYATVSDAMGAASNGDYIYIEPSSYSYDNISVTKELHFIGNGFFLNENPNTSSDKKHSYFDNIQFDNGSQNSSITGIYCGGSITIQVPNITIKRCIANTINAGGYLANNMVIAECYARQISGHSDGARNCIIRNNIVGGSISGYAGSFISGFRDGTQIINNTAIGIIQNFNCSILNNIIDFRATNLSFATTTPCYLCTGSTITNNLYVFTDGVPSTDANCNKVTNDVENVFVASNPWPINIDNKFQLKAGSPAEGIGFGGVSCTGGPNAGAFGGTFPYVLSGIAPIPTITKLVSTAVGNNITPLKVTISVKSNN